MSRPNRKRQGWIESEEKRLRKLDEKEGKAKGEEEEDEKKKPQPIDKTKSSLDEKSAAVTVAKDVDTTKVSTNEGHMIEVFLNDRLGRKIKVKCNSDDTVGDLKKLTAAQIGSRPEKLRIQKWYTVFKDHIMLQDYEVIDGMSLELYYN